MKKIFDIAKDNPLFAGIDRADFDKLLGCIGAKTLAYKKDDVVIMSGGRVSAVGIILSGGMKVIREDRDGNDMILTELSGGEVFGEVFACAGIEISPVTVRASQDSEVLFINYKKIIAQCPSLCEFHQRLVENMLRVIANKNLMLNQKIQILSKRAIREKLLLFFDMQRGGADRFTIAYNREELARYLCVDRSALSAELGRMRDEGIIKFKKNQFQLL